VDVGRGLPLCPGRGPSSFLGVHHDEPEEHHISEPRINDRIRVAEVRLVGPNGEQVGIVRLEDALRLAQDADLDLVEVAPTARPPVCKIMDFGKFKYEADMKAREARRNQANTILKEIRFRLKIDPHDYGTKKGHVERFLKAGDKVKVMIMFRGREQSRPEMGVRLLQRLAADVAELGFIESMPKQDGRNMIMVLGPTKKKAEQRNEQRRAASQNEDGTTSTDESEAPVEHIPWPPVARERRPEPVQTAETPAADTPAEQVQAPAPAASSAPRRSGPPAPRSTSSAPRSTSSAPRSTSAPRPSSSAPRSSAPAARPAASSAPAARPASSPAAGASAPRPAVPRPASTPNPAARPGPPAGGPPKPAPRPGPRSTTDGEKSD